MRRARSTSRLLLVGVACLGIGGSRFPLTAVKTLSIYSFTGGADGSTPTTPLVDHATGMIYGTTYAGGAGHDGTVFRLSPPTPTNRSWTETTLWTFTGGVDGASPVGALIEDANGALYGTASGGGVHHLGTVFMLTPPQAGQTAWTETTLWSFDLAEGGNPSAGLIADKTGTLYGTTASFGHDGYGTVFSLQPPGAGGQGWAETTLWTFTDGPDGARPVSTLLIDMAGNLYGTTSLGGTNPLGGTVFELSPNAGGGPWNETTLWSFSGPDGLHPTAAVIAGPGGTLYGATAFGGANGQGTVFQLTPPAGGAANWTQTVLCDLSPSVGGIFPFSPLLADAAGNLFGTTYGFINQVYTQTAPTIFRLSPTGGSPPWAVSVLASLDPKLIGQNVGGLATDGYGKLFGSAVLGKAHGAAAAPGGIYEAFNSGFKPFPR